MKKKIGLMTAAGLVLWTGLAYAPLVTTFDDSASSSSSSDDTSVVDLSDVDTDQPTWSPSFENETPSGWASGGPISDEE